MRSAPRTILVTVLAVGLTREHFTFMPGEVATLLKFSPT